MPSFPASFTIQIDGATVDPGSVEILPQRSAFPGGHAFAIRVTGPEAERIKSRLLAITGRLGREPTVSEVFSELAIARRRTRPESTRIRWFLNTVTDIQRETSSSLCMAVVRR